MGKAGAPASEAQGSETWWVCQSVHPAVVVHGQPNQVQRRQSGLRSRVAGIRQHLMSGARVGGGGTTRCRVERDLAGLRALHARVPLAETCATGTEEDPSVSKGSSAGQETKHQVQQEPVDAGETGGVQLAPLGCHTSGVPSGRTPLPQPPTGDSGLENGILKLARDVPPPGGARASGPEVANSPLVRGRFWADLEDSGSEEGGPSTQDGGPGAPLEDAAAARELIMLQWAREHPPSGSGAVCTPEARRLAAAPLAEEAAPTDEPGTKAIVVAALAGDAFAHDPPPAEEAIGTTAASGMTVMLDGFCVDLGAIDRSMQDTRGALGFDPTCAQEVQFRQKVLSAIVVDCRALARARRGG